ncbi:cobalamin-binding protein [Aliifodinibius salipaludis]|uniref:Cobalamin-binding protein n=1 Tax=Fodinibius salipaludis TaxID=2032627 RepID=A0A2A2GBB5_9BACT|nr:cobalamin-binding protein [Aliifodinibius salipaludis]PAU94167.1 cobalamin-binding protein [Aliifodinibius salipaludis]
MRIVSLLPSTTEIVATLGKVDQLVGRSHECNYPDGIDELPSCTEPKFNPDGSSYEIDQRVKALLQEGLSVYRVDEEELTTLNPDIILTQDHCEVCAASFDEVQEAVKSTLGANVKVISVSPTDLSSWVQSIRTIAGAIDAEKAAEALTQHMKSKLQDIQQKTSELTPPKVLSIEWMDPLMTAGNWIPELVQIAGGIPIAAEAGTHSPQISWDKVQRLNPDIITIIPCGYSIEQTLSEISTLTSRNGWKQLRAVKNKQVFIADGDHYFNRPGPRLVDSARILAEIIHPSLFRDERHPEWINLATHQFHQTINSLG